MIDLGFSGVWVCFLCVFLQLAILKGLLGMMCPMPIFLESGQANPSMPCFEEVILSKLWPKQFVFEADFEKRS